MSRFFSLKIEGASKSFDVVSEIFKYVPVDDNLDWEYTIDEDISTIENPLEYLVELLTDKLPQLIQLGFKKENISLWYLYEYDIQCNMEFSSDLLFKIAKLGIDFCISCWEKGSFISLGENE